MKRNLLSFLIGYLFTGAILNSYSQNGNYTRNTENGAAPGTDNTIVGLEAGLLANTNSTENVLLGRKAGVGIMNAQHNVIIGTKAFSGSVASAVSNVVIGWGGGIILSSPEGQLFGNTVLGASAGLNLRGNLSTYIGYSAGSSGGNSWLVENCNSFIGAYSGAANTGWSNTFLGGYSGSINQTGAVNVMVGYGAGRYSTQNDASANKAVFVGGESGFNHAGQYSTFVGYQAGYGGTGSKGELNVALGYQSSMSILTGTENTTVGSFAGRWLTDGKYNVFIGNSTGLSNTTGTGNTYVGYRAAATGPIAASLQNASAIGINALVGVSYGLVLGDTTGTNVGIGTAYPNQRLTIRGNMNFLTASNLRFDNSPFLDINQNRLALGGEKGEFPVEITSSLRYKVASENQWADYVFAPAFRKLPIMEVAAFIQQNGHLPGIPSAKEVVENGVDAAQMDTKLLSQIEQLTLYAIEQQRDIEELKKENQQLRLEKESQRKDIQALKNQVNSILIHANR